MEITNGAKKKYGTKSLSLGDTLPAQVVSNVAVEIAEFATVFPDWVQNNSGRTICKCREGKGEEMRQ